MDPASPQFAQLKSSLKSAWMAGDFGEVAKHAAHEGEAFVGQLGLKPGDVHLNISSPGWAEASLLLWAGSSELGKETRPCWPSESRS